MKIKIIYFLIGFSVATISCVYYFSNLIQKQNEFIESDFHTNLNLSKAAYSDEVLPVIELSNIAIQRAFVTEPSFQDIELMRLLLASNDLLNKMTLQTPEVKEQIFLTSALFFKRTESDEQLNETIIFLEKECKLNNIMPDCSENEIKKILALIK